MLRSSLNPSFQLNLVAALSQVCADVSPCVVLCGGVCLCGCLFLVTIPKRLYFSRLIELFRLCFAAVSANNKILAGKSKGICWCYSLEDVVDEY